MSNLSREDHYVVLIEPERSIKMSGSLHNEFKFIIENSEYSEYFHSLSSSGQYLRGIVPVGKLKSRALNRIFLFGEAGQMNPSATATCLTQLLYSYKEIGEILSVKIKNNRLGCKELSLQNPYYDNNNRNFHLHLFNNILNWKSDDFSKLVVQMNKMNNNLVNDIIFGEVDFYSLSNIKYLLKLINDRNYFILNPLIKTFLTRTS